MHDETTALFLLRLSAGLLLVLTLGGLGPTWLLTAAIVVVVLLSPPSVDAAIGMASRGAAGVRQLLGRRWFEASLGAIVLCGVVIRLVGIRGGLWHEGLDIDERSLGDSVLVFFRTGALAHGTSEEHPGLHFWWLAGAGLVAYVWGLMSGLMRGIDDAQVELFVLAGRVANVGLAALTAVFTGLIGRAVAGRAAGLLAAFIFLASPLSLETSTLLRNDVGMACAVVLCVYAAIRASEDPSRIAPWLLGALAGCAAGIKVTAVFVLAPALLAAALAPGRRRAVQDMAIVTASFAGALAVSNHFIWSDFSNFVRQIAMDYGHVQPGHGAYTDTPRAAYLELITGHGVGWPLAACAGGFAAYVVAAGRRRDWVFLAFPVAYLWFMTLKHALFPRWAYVLIPFVAVAASAGLTAGARLLARLPRGFSATRASIAGRLLGAAACVAILLPFVWMSSVVVSRRFTRPTFVLAESWLEGIAAAGDRVLAEVGFLDLSRSGAEVVRVASLPETLARNGPEVRSATWIVVPEHQFGTPELSNLVLVKQFVISTGFGGNVGSDVRVYVPRPAPPDGH